MPTNLLISAADTLFFRDGRPFTMGEDTYVGGINFPPNPSVLYGALYSAFQQDISVRNVWLREKSTNYFSLPKDLVIPKDSSRAKGLVLQSMTSAGCITSSHETVSHFLSNNANEKLRDGSFLIGAIHLQAYLRGKDEQFECIPLSNFLSNEVKIGIGRNKVTKIAQDGMLYRIAMQRSDLKIGISVEGLEADINNPMPFQLGGEKKIAWIEASETSASPKLPDLSKTNRFKIYLATPAIFMNGFMPSFINKKQGLKLLTAAVDKPINIGGWDIAGNLPKPMLQSVPAGSVYYVEADTEEIAQRFATEIHGKSISEYQYESPRAGYTFDSKKQGFGIAFIGRI